MDGHYNVFILLIMFLTICFQLGSHTTVAVRIEITPDTFTNLTSDEVRISCLPEKLNEGAQEIVFMKITRNGYKKSLAYIHHDLKIVYSTNASTHDFKIVGRIDKNPLESYLNLTLKRPRIHDTGIYTCAVFYVDGDGFLQLESDSGNLHVQQTDVATLETLVKILMKKVTLLNETIQILAGKDPVDDVLDKVKELEGSRAMQCNHTVADLKDEITALQRTTQNHTQQIESLATKDSVVSVTDRVVLLESTVTHQSRRLEDCCKKDEANDVLERVQDLEEAARNQSRQVEHIVCDGELLSRVEDQLTVLTDNITQQSIHINSIDERVSRTSAFSATLNEKHKLSVEEVIVFSDVIMSQGQGYDPKTGIFTAPFDGLYAFHIVAMVNCYDCYVDISLMSNDKEMAILSVESDRLFEQCSVSMVTRLVKGDKVKAVLTSMSDKAVLNPNKLSLFSGYLISVN